MNAKSKALLLHAKRVMGELSEHPVLGAHWPRISLVLKGSTARGNADRYSDIDLVFFVPDRLKRGLVSEYRRRGMCQRADGVFMFVANGHYHIETFEQLQGYFAQGDFLHCWEFEHAIPLSDPSHRFARIVRTGQRLVFRRHVEILKRAYLDLQLDLDWMRMPILRADGTATFLHAASIIQGVCRMGYLLDRKSYPPNKWLARYLGTTRFGKRCGRAVEDYLKLLPRVTQLRRHEAFEDQPLYQRAGALIGKTAELIRQDHGSLPWLDEWYNFV